MSDTAFTIFQGTRIETQCLQINGAWHRLIRVVSDGGEQHTITVYAETRGQLSLVEQPDEFVRITGKDPKVERSMQEQFSEQPPARPLG